jgi:hypothetical protein
MASAGAVVHWSHTAPGRDDLLPVLALATGALLVTRAAFPDDWAIEDGEEYLHVLAAHTDALLRVLAEFRSAGERFASVRIRAWQRAKDWFDASRCFERLLSDLELALEDGPR